MFIKNFISLIYKDWNEIRFSFLFLREALLLEAFSFVKYSFLLNIIYHARRELLLTKLSSSPRWWCVSSSFLLSSLIALDEQQRVTRSKDIANQVNAARVYFVMPHTFLWKAIGEDMKHNIDCSFMIFTRRSTHSFALFSAIFVSKHAVCYMKYI